MSLVISFVILNGANCDVISTASAEHVILYPADIPKEGCASLGI
jgi:hypothetical protein